jgi:hypothetical protein
VAVPDASALRAWLDRVPRAAAGPAVETLRAALTGQPARADVVTTRHGSVVCHAVAPDGARRRILEFDRRGTLLAVLRWRARALDAAWVRGGVDWWLAIEPGAGGDAPWGASDRLGRCAEPGGATTALTVFEALDWTAPALIPTLGDPARVPAGAGTAVLNLIAALAADHGVQWLRYTGPYPGEQLFLSLLESFRFVAGPGSGGGAASAPGDPLAAFASGALAWEPAPHERLLTPEGALVHLRGRVEKVLWRGRVYHRPDWAGVVRHAPRRVRDDDGRVVCSLWALGVPVEDHLALSSAGDVQAVLEPPLPSASPRPLPQTVVRAAGAIVAATSVPALARFVVGEAGGLALEWGPVAGDLVQIDGRRARLSTRLRDVLADRAARVEGPERAALGLAALVEIAMLVGDALRARAQARIATLPPVEQMAALAAPPAPAPDDAATITDGAAALLADATDTA